MKTQTIHCRIRERSFLARIAARNLKSSCVAVTLGRTIHLWNTDKQKFLEDNEWVRHELCHVNQFRRYGFFRFLGLYLAENIRHGYRNNHFETEARKAETGDFPCQSLFEFR